MGSSVVGLGHDFKGDVVEHPFFGSQKVVEAMKEMKGWDNGLIVLQANAFLKSHISNLIERLDVTKEIFGEIDSSFELLPSISSHKAKACVC